MSISQNQQSYPKYVGVDLGQKHDFSVIAVVEKKGQDIYLAFLKRFGLGTEYASVIGYLNRINLKLLDVRRILIDRTGVGEVFVEDAINSGLKNARGIHLSLPEKQEVMVYLKQQIQDGRVHIPFDRDLLNEMNIERYELTKTGQVQFNHPNGTHDDRLWAFALAVYVSRLEVPEYHPVALTGKVWKPRLPGSPKFPLYRSPP